MEDKKGMKFKKAQKISVVLFLITGFVYAEEPKNTTNWPCFHGVRYDNISDETGLLEKWPKGGPKLLWTFKGCGKGYSTVSIVDGMIFTAGDFKGEERLIALDMKGEQQWSTKNGKSWTGSFPGSRTSPTYSEGMLYHMGPNGSVGAFDAKTGKEKWVVNVKERFRGRYGTWGFSENIAVEGDLVLCMPGGSDGFVVALDKKTGETVWKNTEIDSRAAYGTPLIVSWKGIRQYISLTGREAVSIDIRTGKKLWSHPHRTPYNQAITQPVFFNGYVFITSGHSGGGRVIKIGPNQRKTKEIWYRKNIDSCHGGIIFVNNRLYGSSCRVGGKIFFCVDFLSGKIIKSDKTLGKNSLTYADGKIYAMTNKGLMRLLDVTSDGFETISEFQLPQNSRNKNICHPVVCGGRLYIRHGTYLYVYDVSKS